MKTLSFVLAMTLSFSAFAGVKEDVASLGKLAMGYGVHSVKGKNAEQIFKNWLIQDNGEAEELVYKEARDMDYGDEVEEGFTSLNSAIEMGGFAQGALEEAIEYADVSEVSQLKKELLSLKKNWAHSIRKLDKQGVKFGYTGFGPGYCGVSFVELIIIDVKEQKLYEVYLSNSGEC